MAKLQKAQVQMMRKQYWVDGFTIKQVMEFFKTPYTTTLDVCNYITHVNTPDIFSRSQIKRR